MKKLFVVGLMSLVSAGIAEARINPGQGTASGAVQTITVSGTVDATQVNECAVTPSTLNVPMTSEGENPGVVVPGKSALGEVSITVDCVQDDVPFSLNVGLGTFEWVNQETGGNVVRFSTFVDDGRGLIWAGSRSYNTGTDAGHAAPEVAEIPIYLKALSTETLRMATGDYVGSIDVTVTF